MRTRQSPYETIEDCSDVVESLLCWEPRRRREETAWKRGRISDVSVMCDDVLCFLWAVLKVNWFCAICNSRGFIWQMICNLILYLLVFLTNWVVVIIQYLSWNRFQYQWWLIHWMINSIIDFGLGYDCLPQAREENYKRGLQSAVELKKVDEKDMTISWTHIVRGGEFVFAVSCQMLRPRADSKQSIAYNNRKSDAIHVSNRAHNLF